MSAPFEPYMKPCARCRDFGILRLRVNGQDEETLAYCKCDWFNKCPGHIWDLPQVSWVLEQAFEVSQCPLGWFLPDNERESVLRGQLIPSLQPIADRWKARVRKAEAFWRDHAQTFGVSIAGHRAVARRRVERGGA
jgi:hypothetical protein